MKTVGTLLFALFLIACGGGSDTSSDAGSSSVTESGTVGGGTGSTRSGDTLSSASSPATANTYRGTVDVTLSAPGYPDTDKSTPVTVVITGSSVKLTAEGRTASTSLNGNTFSADIPITESKNGISCTGTATVNGTVSGRTISGPVTGSGTCNVGGKNVPVKVVGKINARS